MPVTYTGLGAKIKALRETKGLTQVDLAEKLNTSQQVISNIEKDEEGNLPISRLVEISNSLEVSLFELLDAERIVVYADNGNVQTGVIGYNAGTINSELLLEKLIGQYEARIADLQQVIQSLSQRS